MHAVLIALLAVAGAGDSASVAEQQPAAPVKVVPDEREQCPQEEKCGCASWGACGFLLTDWLGGMMAPPHPPSCASCWLGKRRMYRDPPIHAHYYRRPYDYRRSFDHPWR